MTGEKTCEQCRHWEDGELFFNCKTRIGSDPKWTCVQFEQNWLKAFEEYANKGGSKNG